MPTTIGASGGEARRCRADGWSRRTGRPRPGIIVQADELGDNTTTLLACPLSSDVQSNPNPRLRPVIEPTAANGLRVPSQIMTDKLLAQRRERVRRVIGTIDARQAAGWTRHC